MKLGINGRFYGTRVTGVQRFAREMSSRLYSRLDVTLFLPASASRPSEVPDHVPIVRGQLDRHLWEQVELPWWTRAERCDVVLNLSGTAPRWGGPHVVVVYDVTPLTHPEWFTPAFRMWFRVALGRSAQRAAGVLAISEWTRSEMERVLGIPASRIPVIKQGLEPFSAPAPVAAVEGVRARWNLPQQFLLGLGGRNPRKNLGFLLAMLVRWRERYGDAPCLVLVGEEFSHLHSQVELSTDPLTDLRVLGHISDGDLHALYTAASAFCFPSLAEGFGRPPLEAMACGTPAIAADYGCAAEVLGSGALIVPLQVDRWIDAIFPLLAGGPERERWTARGREQASTYRWETAIDGVLDVCRAAAKKPGQG